MKPKTRLHHRLVIATVCSLGCVLPLVGQADTIFTINNTTADAFLSGASPTLNFGHAGTLAVAPAASPKGQLDSVIQFNTGAAITQFNTTYGASNWQITGLTLQLASNFGDAGDNPGNPFFNTISGGHFGISWLANDSWVEGAGGGMGAANGAVSFNSISSLFSPGSDSLGNFTYTPPGDNIYVNYALPLNGDLVSDAAAGGLVSLYFNATDAQISFLFNSRDFGSNHPQLSVMAAPVPEPGTALLLAVSFGRFLFWRRAGKK